MDKRKAFEIVYNELIKNPLLQGNYDAKHGNEHFMYGISTVMECIAYNISEQTGDNFSDTFIDNMIESEMKD